jgi:predicted component of type VI protein secretion system
VQYEEVSNEGSDQDQKVIQPKQERVRPPRVSITYDEIGDTTSIKARPFVVGLLGHPAGTPAVPQPKLKDAPEADPQH